MKEEIRQSINDVKQLEKLYRSNKQQFKKEFAGLYPEFSGNLLAECWNERLFGETEEGSRFSGRDLVMIIGAALLAGIIARLPEILAIDENRFFPRNIGFIVFPFLTAYFAWKNKLSAPKTGGVILAILAAIVFINVLPDNDKSDTLILSCVHLALFQWGILGFVFTGGAYQPAERRLGYLRFNGDLVVITTLIVIAGAILSAVTIGLFSLIGLQIEDFYAKNILVFALPAAPFLGTYLTQTNPQLVGKISPVIARIFSPLVLVMLVTYLAAMVYAGKNPYNDREFLLIFNALLIGVMAIIFFSVAETTSSSKNRFEVIILFLLSAVTVVVNAVALSAILFRISSLGITPNRAAVMGGNLLILVNLLWVTARLFKAAFKNQGLEGVGKAISLYLPVYVGWTIIVTFIFPLIFGFR